MLSESLAHSLLCATLLHSNRDGIEVKRRSHKMAAAFRTEESYLLLFYAIIYLSFARINGNVGGCQQHLQRIN